MSWTAFFIPAGALIGSGFRFENIWLGGMGVLLALTASFLSGWQAKADSDRRKRRRA